ncbi:MAG TPA: 50S ribosomal protein L22 [Candidatus Nanoarchaeia archaeon]|nr:50S ribosomal protein L22 [Candidatus Nanoarchaeia archaeon]
MKGYTFQGYKKENMARVQGTALPISTKQSVEICNFIKNKNVAKAKQLLLGVIDKKVAVPFNRYNWDLGHKTGIGPGRYPEKASEHFIQMIESVEANAQFKGLNTSNLVIVHASAHLAGKSWHYGRKSRRKMKRTNLEIVVEEKKAVEKVIKPKKEVKNK